MQGWRGARAWNPGAWMVAAGLALLGFSLWIPWLSASRTTRIERRADGVAHALLDAATPFPRPLDEADLQSVFARTVALADARAVFVNDLERVEPAPEGVWLCLRNKHYLFQLTESPPEPNERPGRQTVPALEVTAWPIRSVGPGHCAFFYPEGAERAYTRNLRRSYAGLDDRPGPGRSHRRPGLGGRQAGTYTGHDDERWILF